VQVANFLEFSAEDGEAERKKAISDIVDLGQDVWVKVRAGGGCNMGQGAGCGGQGVGGAATLGGIFVEQGVCVWGGGCTIEIGGGVGGGGGGGAEVPDLKRLSAL
jgi:hypothetical protein